MTPNIQKLIDTWNKRPARVEPDNEEHLLYVFTELLPAVRDSMADIANTAYLVNQMKNHQIVACEFAGGVPILKGRTLEPGVNSPNTVGLITQVQEPNIHSPQESPSMADTAEVTDRTVGSADKPASETATPALKPWQKANAARVAKAAAKKLAALPPAVPQGTGETGTV